MWLGNLKSSVFLPNYCKIYTGDKGKKVSPGNLKFPTCTLT